jgi:hypothetical protein
VFQRTCTGELTLPGPVVKSSNPSSLVLVLVISCQGFVRESALSPSNRIPQIVNLRRGKVYSGSQFWSSQSMVSLIAFRSVVRQYFPVGTHGRGAYSSSEGQEGKRGRASVLKSPFWANSQWLRPPIGPSPDNAQAGSWAFNTWAFGRYAISKLGIWNKLKGLEMHPVNNSHKRAAVLYYYLMKYTLNQNGYWR